MVTAALIARASAGDNDAFRDLTEPYRRELKVHCYRVLGSLQDAEDALQDTLLTAWRSLGGFEGRASIRTWLYRIATTRCLNALRSASRRPAKAWDIPGVEPPEPSALGEVAWLEPFPDALLAGAIDVPLGPEARYEQCEAILLAFITALQLLPARQLAVLILPTSSATTRTRLPRCSTRPSNRSTARSNAPARACSNACRRPGSANRLPLTTHPPSNCSWKSSSVHTRPLTSTHGPVHGQHPRLHAADSERVSRPRCRCPPVHATHPPGPHL
jgi:RNA polymerase sigma factor (sigma-70 family)